MTTLKKSTLAIALAMAMGFASHASAFTVTTNGDSDPVLVATFDIADDTTQVGVNETFSVDLVGLPSADPIIGRTTGVSVTITLSNGAAFAQNVTVNPGANLPAGWSVSVANGGNAGDSGVIILITPPSTNPVPGLNVGQLFYISGADNVIAPTTGTGTLILDNLSALQTAGQTVVASVQFTDPVSTNNIMSLTPTTLLKSANPANLTCDATAGAEDARVDVGTNDGAYDSKTSFSYDGSINGGGSYYFDAGDITVEKVSGFTSFSFAGTDEFVTTITGTDFSAFADGTVYLSTSGYCDGTFQNAVGTVSDDGTTITFEYTGADMGIGASGFSAAVCFVNDGLNDVILPSNVTAQTTFTRNGADFAGDNCNLLPIQYNGSVVKVATFNPGGNATQQSFLRITNPSNVDGLVTIDGTDDSGVAGDSSVTFVLGAGKSMQINSDALENGSDTLTGALGDGTGKWRLVVTGEFGGMRVASLNRNTTDGTVTNLTDYDTAQEQSTPNNCGWSGGNSCYTGSDSY